MGRGQWRRPGTAAEGAWAGGAPSPPLSVQPAGSGLWLLREGLPIHGPAGDGQHHGLGGIDPCGQLQTVQHQGEFQRGVSDALVPVHKGVVLDEGEAECGRFGDQVGIEISTGKALPRQGQRSLQEPQIPQARAPAALRQQAPVQLQHLSQLQPAHQARRRYSSAFLPSTR